MLLAYNFVAIVVLLAEANYCAEKLSLPINRPITETQLSYRLIAPTNILASGGFGGRIDSGQYSFTFGHHHRRYVVKLAPFGGLSVAEQNEKLSHEKSLINTSQAYQLATNWLRLIDVDVQALEKSNKFEVRQRWYGGGSQSAPKILLPIFYVRWGEWDHPKIEIEIDGRSKQFLAIRQEDDSFSRRPTELIKDLDKLLAISDEEFQTYSPVERSNLAARFSAVAVNSTNKVPAIVLKTNESNHNLQPQRPPAHPLPPATPVQLARQIANADRIICTNLIHSPDEPGHSLLVSGVRARKIIKAISAAEKLKDGSESNCIYDWEVQFYMNTNRLAEVTVCGGMFMNDGREFTDKTGELEKLYDEAVNLVNAGK